MTEHRVTSSLPGAGHAVGVPCWQRRLPERPAHAPGHAPSAARRI